LGGEAVKIDDRQPIIVADTGPLIRLAAAGLLETMRLLNRRVVLVDRVEDEAIADLTKPFAIDIKTWIEVMGEAVWHVPTVEGQGIKALRKNADTPELRRLLKNALRNSGERAIREFVEIHAPRNAEEALVVYEDIDLHDQLAATMVPLTAVTTRRFAQVLNEWGINVDAEELLSRIPARLDLKPAQTTIFTPFRSNGK
jgi:hypothetical protein